MDNLLLIVMAMLLVLFIISLKKKYDPDLNETARSEENVEQREIPSR